MSTGHVNPPPLPGAIPMSDSLGAVDPSTFSSINSISSDFLGFPLSDNDHLWGIGSISPTMAGGSWDSKIDSATFAHASLERDLKNAQVRNGQPTPPPYQDQRSQQTSSPELEPASKRRRARESRVAAASMSPDLDDYPRDGTDKRAKFLERNRLAASKCRQKKKEHTQQLEQRYKEQSEKKETLVAEIARLRSEILNLKNEVLKHAQCGDEPIKLHLAQMVKKITDHDGASSMGLEHVMQGSQPARASPVDRASTPASSVSAAACTTAPLAAVSSALSFGFDDPLHVEPAAAASVNPFEQQFRRDSEATMVSESSLAFSAEDNFDDLINV
ncbi:Transcription factor atf21-like protein [Penicillium ucsense]|uniref:Transcription factor atf21-like protein n=1 Tax=Penicillium ucsense TaxID=2839758 RepID=A0A8J8W691_9EURO|nr:Transcription factor atf21-like protein [Penicillium ucsense]KAF7737541.1 Transcription factor atf21-like protein [Penicillium ucsense]